MTTESGIERLEALGGMAAEVDGAHPAAVEAEEQRAEGEAKEAAAQEAGAQAWGMIPFAIGGTLAIIEPRLREVYTQEACYAWGEAASAVARKYGWDSPGNLPELALATATIGFALPSFFMVRDRLAEMREGKASGWLAKVGTWWRARKAARAAAKAAPGEGIGAAVPAEASA